MYNIQKIYIHDLNFFLLQADNNRHQHIDLGGSDVLVVLSTGACVYFGGSTLPNSPLVAQHHMNRIPCFSFVSFHVFCCYACIHKILNIF
jgi:hypothetical protein